MWSTSGWAKETETVGMTGSSVRVCVCVTLCVRPCLNVYPISSSAFANNKWVHTGKQITKGKINHYWALANSIPTLNLIHLQYMSVGHLASCSMHLAWRFKCSNDCLYSYSTRLFRVWRDKSASWRRQLDLCKLLWVLFLHARFSLKGEIHGTLGSPYESVTESHAVDAHNSTFTCPIALLTCVNTV